MGTPSSGTLEQHQLDVLGMLNRACWRHRRDFTVPTDLRISRACPLGSATIGPDRHKDRCHGHDDRVDAYRAIAGD